MDRVSPRASPIAAIGLPLFEGGELLGPALESLLAQTRTDFVVVALDDSGSGAAADLLASYSDERLLYEPNPARLGLAGNWQRTFETAIRLFPACPYFAWASDHDTREPHWLERLVDELEAHPRAVLAYGRSGSWRFETRDDRWAARRFARTLRRMVAGDMVYGLFRTSALSRTGVYRPVLLPDRLLLAELSLHGEFLQVDEALWHRQRPRGAEYSVERQRRAIFPQGAPWWSRLPWWITHSALLGWRLAIRGAGRPRIGRVEGALAGLGYALLAPGFGAARRVLRSVGRGYSPPPWGR